MKVDSTLQTDAPGARASFVDTPAAVTSFLNAASTAQAAVQKEIEAFNKLAQTQDFSSTPPDPSKDPGPPATDGTTTTDAAASPAYALPPAPPPKPAAPNLTDGSTKLSSVDPASVPVPSPDDKRSPGDDRSAQQIQDQNPLLKNLGNQDGMRDGLKKQCGDIDHDPDAAYRAVMVLNYVKTSYQSDGKTQRSADVVDNGKIEGATKDANIRHGTEGALVKDFGEKGYAYLKSTNHSLTTTNDSHVPVDGSENMGNAKWVGHEVLHGLSEAFKWMAKITEKVLGKIPGIGKLIADAADVVDTAISGALNVADTALKHGDVKKAGKDMAADLVGSVVNIADPTGMGGDAASKAIKDKIGG